MKVWIASGDETGHWDIENGQFGSDFLGVALVLGTAQAWDLALQMPVGDKTALEVFSEPIVAPLSETLPSNTSTKYHVIDVWKSVPRVHAQDVQLDTIQSNPTLELLRFQAEWLLQKSGLGVLAVGGSRADAKDVVSNKFRIWLVRFGRTASLQIAHVAWPHRAICA